MGRPRRRFDGPAPALHVASAAAPHHLETFERIEGANEHRGGRAACLGDDIHQAVDTVIEINVRVTRRAVKGLIAARRSGRGVAGWVGFADVRFGFDDGAARANAAALVHQHLADEIARDVERGTIVEPARQLHRHVLPQSSQSSRKMQPRKHFPGCLQQHQQKHYHGGHGEQAR